MGACAPRGPVAGGTLPACRARSAPAQGAPAPALHRLDARRARCVELAEKHGLRLPEAADDLVAAALSAADERGWFRFQRLYDAARACVRDEADMRRIVREAAQDDAAEGSRWLEIQVDPTSYAPFVGGITPALEIVLDEARPPPRRRAPAWRRRRGRSRIRHPLDARTLARLAARYAGEGPGPVVGFGLSNDERRGVTAEFARAFEIARRAGLALRPARAASCWGRPRSGTTLERCGPTGSATACAAPRTPGCWRWWPRRGVALEVCPGSNVALGVYADAAEVPLRATARRRRYRWPSAPTTRCCSARGWPRSTSSPRTALGLLDEELAAPGPRVGARRAGPRSRSQDPARRHRRLAGSPTDRGLTHRAASVPRPCARPRLRARARPGPAR